ncbi:HAMP domain-containing sensor histidine kinase [Parageobacillus thermoglucosidasius]|uniref:HAMP domain-containing sensor histidine kinase n=1 Tax=Parageobacillus thermoglucosidasius TaxID=1426 RepID=UPI001FCCB860|nr:HAMP domain-containing sensor histidine kinase [Parageobacillus thermoglucosidasius]BDG34053.1 two-component sensor histidine kinase [Parageobacillus thermoglucosidasius]
MSLRRRLTLHFSLHFILMLCLILLFILGSFFFPAYFILESEMKADFARASEEYLNLAITIEDGKAVINESVKESIRKKGGWLQVVDSKGSVIGEYNAPKELPKRYDFTHILSMDFDNFRTYYWILKKDDDSEITVIYGAPFKSKQILNTLLRSRSFPYIDTDVKNYLVKQNAWIQVYDASGNVVYSYHAPPKLKLTYTEILSMKKAPWNSKIDISSYYDKEKDQMFVVGTSNPYYSPDHITDSIIGASLLNSFLVVFGILLVFAVAVSIWYSKKFGKPLLYMMKWISNMSKGNYMAPKDKKGRIPILNKKGSLHKRYKIFREIVDSLYTLSNTLQQNEETQRRMEKTREEWITGLSHDLKTPLSSLYGFSALLASDQYQWSPEEIREMGRVMKEKATYMSELIEDLNLTYRLKNNALPIHKEKKDIVSLLKEFLAAFAATAEAQEKEIDFESTQDVIFLEIDPKWFTRILDNLLANAVKHNRPGTKIKVKAEANHQCTVISIEDNGIGMDEETVKNLFNRYYRGGNTQDSDSGSGLGMAIAHQLVVAHGGEIIVESEKHVGTTIKMVFPRTNDG